MIGLITQEFISGESFEPIGMGIFFVSKISSVRKSGSVSLFQPILSGKIFSSAGVLIGAEVLILLTRFIFKLDKVPVLNISQNQVIQMPIGELQSLLHYMSSRQTTTGGTTPPTASSVGATPAFPTILPPDAPFFVGLYLVSDYSNQLYTPSLYLLVPILSFPGLTGTLPILILGLLVTIFVRCVVPPETTGSKPLTKPSEQPNPSLSLHPEELLGILNRFGKYFRSQ